MILLFNFSVNARKKEKGESMVLELIVGIGLIVTTITSTASILVQLAGNRICHSRELLLLLLEVLGGGSGAVLVKPFGGLLNSVEDLDLNSLA